MKLNQRHSIRLKIFWNYFSERIHKSIEIIKIETEFEFMKFIIEKNQFLNWNQFKKQSIQLIKLLQSISKINIDFDCDLIENFNHMIASWQNSIQSIGLARSETSTRCRPGNGLLGLANIWSRLLKHNWWDPLYGRVRTHSDVFFGFTFNENSSLYGYINRASPEFQPMHVYDQQLCFLFHRCGPPSLFLNSWR